MLALIGVAALRGIFRGTQREALALASMAAACICVYVFIDIVIACILLVLNGFMQPVVVIFASAILVSIPWWIESKLETWWIESRLAQNLRQGIRGVGIRNSLFGFLLGMARGVLFWTILMMVAARVSVPMLEKLLERLKSIRSLGFYEGFIGG